MQTLTTRELHEMTQRTNDLAVINVLPKDQFDNAHIRGSVNAPVGSKNFESEVERIAGGRDKPVVVYCASTECDASPKAAKRLDEAGFEKVYDYEAGVKAWSEAGLPVESSN